MNSLQAFDRLIWLNITFLNVSQNSLPESDEGFLDVRSCFCGSLKIYEVVPLRELLGLGFDNLPVLLEVAFVADEDDICIRRTEAVEVVDPHVELIKRLPLRQIEDEDSTERIPEICLRYAPETLLAGCVPNLELNVLVVRLETVRFEFNADRGLAFLLEILVHEPVYNGRLADARGADNDDFVAVWRIAHFFFF